MLRLLTERITVNVKSQVNFLSTWSPLATAFNSKTSEKFDSLFGRKETGLFCIPELDNAEGFSVLESRALARTNELVQEVVAGTSGNRSRKMVEIFDELSDTLCQVADMAEFVRIAHPDKDFAQAAEQACIMISGVVEKLNVTPVLYNSLSDVVKNGDVKPTSDMDDHVAKLFLFDFEQCGIHLQEFERKKVVKLNDYILQVGQKFMAGAVEPRSIGPKLLPKGLASQFASVGDEVVIHGLHSDSSDCQLREAAYRIYLYPDPQQEYLLRELLNSRHELARLCGFPSYTYRAVRGSTAETPEAVCEFLNILNTELKDRALYDFAQMQKLKDADSQIKQNVMPWDTAYFCSYARKSWIRATNEEFTPYFSLGACMDGLNLLTQALYGVRLENQPTISGEVWCSSVKKLAVIDEDETTLGYIYCDFFERKNKPHQDCHFTIRGGRELPDGTYQNPIVVLMLSLPGPRWSGPCLLHPSSVDNLFHEMGHALHSMLGRTKYQHVTGTRCSTDFAEVPSVLMEYFASDPRVVSLFARHYQTQEKMPQAMLEKLCAMKNIFPASELQNQVFYSMLDQVYHSSELHGSSTDILADIQSKYYSLPYVPNTAWQLRFSHLVGYGAKYYSYLISKAIASWIWQTYFQMDPLSRCAGEKYRRECLAHGGGKPPSKLVSDFLNKEANPSNLAESLVNEIDSKLDQVRTMRQSIP